MSFAKYLVKLLCYSDDVTSNDPQEVDFDWYKEFAETVSNPDATTKECVVGDNVISVNSGSKWLAVVTDQNLIIKLNSDTGEKVTVQPTAAGVQDGFLMIRIGSLSSLTINVPGAEPANVKIFTSA